MVTPNRPAPVSPRVIRRRRLLVGSASVAVLGALIWALVAVLSPVSPPPEPMPTPAVESAMPTPTPTETPAPRDPGFDKTAHSIDDPMSIWVVADKLRPLNPLDFAPSDLVVADVPYAANATMRAEAADALERMFAAAAEEGAGGMMVQNAFRPYDTQAGLYAGHVQRLGQSQADIASARPGHSEH
jgi:D-alanyl-D-alanine carboxypeptidase